MYVFHMLLVSPSPSYIIYTDDGGDVDIVCAGIDFQFISGQSGRTRGLGVVISHNQDNLKNIFT